MDKTSEAKKTSQISSRKRLMVIPFDIARDSRLSSGAKLLYGEISNSVNYEGYSIMSNSYFASIQEISSSTVKRQLSELLDREYITRDIIVEGTLKERRLYLNDEKNK